MDLLGDPLEKQLAPDGQSPIVTPIRCWKIDFRAESVARKFSPEHIPATRNRRQQNRHAIIIIIRYDVTEQFNYSTLIELI